MNLDAKVIELEIIKSKNDNDSERLTTIRESIGEELTKLDYFLTKFLGKYGRKLDTKKDDNYNKFYSDKTAEYASLTRLIRIIDAYGK